MMVLRTTRIENDSASGSRSQSSARNFSVRSRASSIISTSTKHSIATFSQEDREQPFGINGLMGPRNHLQDSRPRSIYSMYSFDQPAPPYEEHSDQDNADESINQDDDTDLHLHLSLEDSTRTFQQQDDNSFPSASEPDNPTPSQSPSPSQQENRLHSDDDNRSPSHTAPSMTPSLSNQDPETALRTHYTKLLRQIDSSHAQEIQSLTALHTTQLAAVRNSIDATYRVEWKAKNLEMERVREEALSREAYVQEKCRAEVEALREEIEKLKREGKERKERLMAEWEERVRRERNEVEEEWERRWIGRMRLEGEEKSRFLEGRDRVWAQALVRRWPELEGEIEKVKEGLDGRCGGGGEWRD